MGWVYLLASAFKKDHLIAWYLLLYNMVQARYLKEDIESSKLVNLQYAAFPNTQLI